MGCTCFFNTAVAWGGGEKWHFEVSQYLHQNGHRVFVVAHHDSVLHQKLRKTKIPFSTIKLTNLSFLNPFKHKLLQKLFVEKEITQLVMNLSRDVKIASVAAKKVGITRIIYRRGSAIPIKNSYLNRYLFQNVLTEILANSEATKRTILENNSTLFPIKKIKVIYNGIQIPPTIEAYQNKALETFTLINLGRLEYQKNQTFLLDVAHQLKAKKIPFRLLIGGEGRLREELENKIQQLQLTNVVQLEGFIENPLEFIAKGSVFLLSSHWEGFGYVLAEAALCKKPVVAFDISSNPEVVINQKTGILTTPNNVEAFVEAITYLYHHRAQLLQMGENGYAYVLQNFERNKQLKTIEDYLIHGA
ncbi:glycosyl transferase [Croceivirga lutea]|uniref:glycosyltransferase n=1 Tax=Croceivirga lutea TaxID=1775167 RepID=UPI00163AAAD4|nr:glycosyltransferase [Croceivirga lutea]GGG49561.1 glycosyl transferase [Croceivirga lutea]